MSRHLDRALVRGTSIGVDMPAGKFADGKMACVGALNGDARKLIDPRIGLGEQAAAGVEVDAGDRVVSRQSQQIAAHAATEIRDGTGRPK